MMTETPGQTIAPDDVLTLPFDQYQRYRLIAQVVERLSPAATPTILDVGGWPGTLRRFLPQARVVIADVQGHERDMVLASGTNLPFRDGQFDLVVSSDTLEHVEPAERPPFLRELCRVSRETVVLGAPFDAPEVRLAEAVLREAIREKYPASYRFIEEHVEHGLPDLAATRALLEADGYATVALPNGYLFHWLPMLTLYFALQWRSPYEPLFARLNAFYNATCYQRDNRAPGYRTTIVASRTAPERLLALRAELCPDDRDEPAPDPTFWPQVEAIARAIELETLTSPREPMRRILELEALVEERTAWARQSVRQLAAAEAAIADLQRTLAQRNRLVQALAYLRALLRARRRHCAATPLDR